MLRALQCHHYGLFKSGRQPGGGNTCHGIVAKAKTAISCGFMRKTQFWQRAASAVCEHSTNFPAFPDGGMHSVWQKNTAWSWKIWTMCRFTPPALQRKSPADIFLISDLPAARVQFCSTARANALSMSFCPETRFLLPSMQKWKRKVTKHVWLSFAPFCGGY